MAASVPKRLPPPELLRQLVLGQLTEPVIFHGLLRWPLMSWTWSDWTVKMGSSSLPFRKGKKVITKEPQWERQCDVVHLTLQEFVSAAEQEGYDSWLYFDYKHMAELLQTHTEIVEAVSWARLGFPEKKGLDSTLWIGSTGAHTPCHADTYGCNLVAQVIGRKQWILFPPGASSVLPTRVPYEESSIYSEQNFYSPDPSIAHELYGARVVTLRPGDVLFVPQRWWHYVENLTSAISINVWLPLEQDDEVRLEEGLTRLFVSQLCKDLPVALHTSLLNPNEDDIADMPLSVLLSQLKNCISKCHSDSGGPPDSKKTKLQQESCHTALSEYSDTMEVVQPVSQIVLRSLFEGKIAALQDHSAINISTSSEDELPRKIINAFCQPNIIALVRQNLLSSTVPT